MSAKFVEARENPSAGTSKIGPVNELTSAPTNASAASPTHAFAIPSIVPPSVERFPHPTPRMVCSPTVERKGFSGGRSLPTRPGYPQLLMPGGFWRSAVR